ncbi:8707_t:CDS:10 [Ambispora gerdemannii]|uniref:Peroxisomal ATPase PEX1 n=1 Tax=Ambispora gerdemannii TaxID=144530 RepID=A0A9N8W8E3_9GLOM|nr:8707_t:CDS:10 [Ambispora gerdemannii]
MAQKSHTVSFVSLTNCFINLPLELCNFFHNQDQPPQNVVLELTWTDTVEKTQRKAYVGWTGGASKNSFRQPNLLEIDPQFANALKIAEGQQVFINLCNQAPFANSVSVEPVSVDDWEIVESRPQYLEEHIIRQLRVVYINEIVTLWIETTLVRLKIVEIQPKSVGTFARLNGESEIFVAPKPRLITNGFTKPEFKDLQTGEEKISHVYGLRVLPIEYLPSGQLQASGTNFCTVYVNSTDYLNLGFSTNKITRLSKVQFPPPAKDSPHQNKESEERTDSENGNNGPLVIYAKIIQSEAVVAGHVVVSESIREILEAEHFSIIRLAQPKINPVAISSLTLCAILSTNQTAPLKLVPNQSAGVTAEKTAFSSSLTSAFKDWAKELPQNSDIVLTNGMRILLPLPQGNTNVVVFFGPKKANIQHETRNAKSDLHDLYVIGDKNQLLKVKIEVGDNITPDSKSIKQPITISPPPVLAGVSDLTQRLRDYLRSNLARVPLRAALGVPVLGGLLFCGGHGSGKTSISKAVAHDLSRDKDTLAYTLVIKCTDAAEDRVSTIREKVQQWFDDAAWHAPSIILFDDLDRLIPAEVEHMDSFRFRQLAEIFFQIANKMQKRHRIAILATAQQQASVHSFLTTSHLLSEIAHLNPPTKILGALMSSGPTLAKNSVSKIDLLSIASNCEGYLAADLKALVERAIHEGAVRQMKEKSIEFIDEDDFRRAQKDFVPFSLRGVKLQSSDVSWSDIGGLEVTRKVLLETLEWPTKYAPIFANCPLRLRSGLLLYGFPGCGKTLLASAVAKECGLNFISVKGPELLNKYIGASEKSVRDLFERAQAAKPCVLFFDEFDSIAPKRGHDSTGVTDRVVNQMLTQMDGAEGLDGLFLSRPDLIDPALLRPGRLDKSLFCNMPSLEERIQILKALSRKMHLSEDVDLEVFAKKTQGYSGADLQAVLSNAHLEAIHETIDSEKNTQKNNTSNSDTSDLKFTMFQANTKTSKPSLTLAEKSLISQRLALIRKGFGPKIQKDKIETRVEEKKLSFIKNQHLENSLGNTRPSITPEEFRRLAEIYNEFITGRNGEMPSGISSHEIGQRSTLC